jgi:hypothetical protein
MTQQPSNQSPADSRLEEYLALLQPTPPRDPKAAARTQVKFEAEVDALLEFQEQTAPGWSERLAALLRPALGWQNMAYARLAAVILLAVMLFGSASVTAYAAQGALPGDTLYAVKTGLEELQIQLAARPEKQASLHLAFAGRRLDEAEALIAAGREEGLQWISDSFEAHLAEAWRARLELETERPDIAADLERQEDEEWARYDGLMGVKPAGDDRSQSGGEGHPESDNRGEDAPSNDNSGAGDPINDNGEDISGGDEAEDNSNDNAADNTNDNVVDDNTNDNVDDNTNDDADDNTNDNVDDNTNDNEDDNTNDNVDENANDNVDDNANDNTDEDSNDNDNTSTDENDNVDDSNDNDNEETGDDNDNETGVGA